MFVRAFSFYVFILKRTLQFLEDLGPYLDTFEELGTSFGTKRPGWRVTKYWRSNVPDFRQKVEAAKRVKSNPKPSAEEPTAVMKDCNSALDEAEEVATKLRPRKVKLSKARQVDPGAEAALKRAGLYVPSERRREVEEDTLAKLKPKADRFAGNITEVVILVQVLFVMAVLNVYLNRHHVLGEYPTSEVVYDEAFPIVAKFEELRLLLDRSLDMAKTHSSKIALWTTRQGDLLRAPAYDKV